MSQQRLLRLRDDHGRPLRAAATIEATDGLIRLHLESQSGRSTSSRARNPDYKQALTLLLGRLTHLSGVLVDAAVASRLRPTVSEAPRALRPAMGLPLALANSDPVALRDELIQLQRAAGQRIGAGGSGAQHKRIRLDLKVESPLAIIIAGLEGGGDDQLQDVEDLIGEPPGGREPDGPRRRAVEQYAVRLAMAHYGRQFEHVVSHELTEAFDLLCRTPGELRVEVKGTRSSGAHISMTAAEVALARDPDLATELFVVTDIKLREARGRLQGTGGVVHIFRDWAPSDDALSPLIYRCELGGATPAERFAASSSQ